MNGREDTCKEKHIELHVRTGYSGMCGFGSPDQFLKVHRPEAYYRSWLRLLKDSVEESDYSASPQELRKEILELRSVDVCLPMQDTDRCRALELILEAKLRGIKIS